MKEEKRVLVLGLDGASMDLIKKFAIEGKLPTFYRLMSEGSYGYMESVIPTMTIPAWNCLTTGKNMGKIGCFSFIQKAYRSYDFRLYTSLVRKEEDIWDILSDYGNRVFVFNPSNVQAAYKINGWMVAGCLCTSEDKLTYPRNLKEELYNMGYERDITDLRTLGALSDREHTRRHKEITAKHFKVLFHFLKKEWKFGFFVLNELDRVQHRFWNKKSVIISHYQNIDRKLGELLRRLEKDNTENTIIIVSDHGFGPNKTTFHINEWLIRRNLMKIKREFPLDFVRIFASILKEPVILKTLRPLMRFSLIRRMYQGIFLTTGRTPIEWEKTKAFSYGTFGTIYINLEGREPQGTVKEEEYEKLRTEIIEGLREVSVKAFRREEIYHGEYLYLSPDIIIQTDENINSISSRVGYNRYFSEGSGGAHNRKNATFIAWGADIKENFEIRTSVYDVAPTILHIFGIPIPRDMDGRVLKEIFKGELAMRGVRYARAEERRVRKRIKKLKNRI